MIIEVTDYERPRKLASSTHMSSMDIHGALTFDPVPTGTRMHWLWDVEPIGGQRLLKTLVTSIGRHQEQNLWTSLKHHLEEEAN